MYALGLCLDQAYLLPAMVTLTSAADALNGAERRELALRILTQDLRPSQVEALETITRRLGFASFDLQWRRPPPDYRIIEGDYISTTTYLRFQLTPRFVDRPYLIYLDADVLVQGDIAEPLNGLDSSPLAAVRDEFNYTVGECPALPGLTKDWPKLHGRPYYNAGVLWLRSCFMPVVAAGVSDVMRRGRRYIYHNDQDALNLWLLSSTSAESLPGHYNRFELDRFLERGDWVRRVVQRPLHSADTSLLHFVGPMKPWLKSSPATEAVKLYRSYLSQTRRLLLRIGDRTIDVDTEAGST